MFRVKNCFVTLLEPDIQELVVVASTNLNQVRTRVRVKVG